MKHFFPKGLFILLALTLPETFLFSQADFACDQFDSINDYPDAPFFNSSYCIPITETGDKDIHGTTFSADAGSSDYNPYSAKTYFGTPGGLYPDGKNQRSGSYQDEGIILGNTVITPVYVEGYGSKMVMLSAGGSTPARFWPEFEAKAAWSDSCDIFLLNGSIGGTSLESINNDSLIDYTGSHIPDGTYFDFLDFQLESINATAEQVRVLWCSTTTFFADVLGNSHDIGYNLSTGAFNTGDYTAENFQAYLDYFAAQYKLFLDSCKAHFPNLKMIYLSDRQYEGYRQVNKWTLPVFPPYDHWIGWGVRRVISDYIEGLFWTEPEDPYLTWGAYLWRRGDLADDNYPGMHHYDTREWVCADYNQDSACCDLPGPDGLHLDSDGDLEAADMLYNFFMTDETSEWFRTNCHDTLLVLQDPAGTENIARADIFPSPLTGNGTISITGLQLFAGSDKPELHIFDLTGSLVEKITITQAHQNWHCVLPAGLYAYVLVDNGRTLCAGKFIKLPD